MSNKYFRDWKSSKPSKSYNSSKPSKSESTHLGILKELDRDNARLDRALDKLDTERKAEKIFRGPQNPTQIYSQIGFVNSHSSRSQSQSHSSQSQARSQAHPVHLVHIGQNMILVNGCVLMRPENFF